MPTVLCTCGRDVSYHGAAAQRVVCPHCRRSLETLPPPPPSPARSSGATDLRFPVSLWLLIGLTAVLLPAWIKGELSYIELGGEYIVSPIPAILRATLTPWLLVALGLLVGVRTRAVNLSVWGCAALGAVIAWACQAHGATGWWSVWAAVAAGVCVGMAVVAGDRWAKVPLWSIAAAAGIAAMVGARLVAASLTPLAPETIEESSLVVSGPALYLLLYILLMPVMALGFRIAARHGRVGRPGAFPVLFGCGIAAAAGSFTLMVSGQHHPHGWLISDMRVLAAVILCGGWIWRGRGGLSVACVLLPVAMLVSTMWMDTIGVWLPGIRGTYPVAMLAVMAGAAQWVTRGRGRRVLRRLAGLTTVAGTLVVAIGANWPAEQAALQTALVGIAIWLAGVALGVYRLRLQRAEQQADLTPAA